MAPELGPNPMAHVLDLGASCTRAGLSGTLAPWTRCLLRLPSSFSSSPAGPTGTNRQSLTTCLRRTGSLRAARGVLRQNQAGSF